MTASKGLGRIQTLVWCSVLSYIWHTHTHTHRFVYIYTCTHTHTPTICTYLRNIYIYYLFIYFFKSDMDAGVMYGWYINIRSRTGRRHSASGRLLFAAGCAAAWGSGWWIAWPLGPRDGWYVMAINARKGRIHGIFIWLFNPVGISSVNTNIEKHLGSSGK